MLEAEEIIAGGIKPINVIAEKSERFLIKMNQVQKKHTYYMGKFVLLML